MLQGDLWFWLKTIATACEPLPLKTREVVYVLIDDGCSGHNTNVVILEARFVRSDIVIGQVGKDCMVGLGLC